MNALVANPVTALPSPAQWSTIVSMATALCQSGMIPQSIKTPQAAAAIILKGRELGIPPMQAFAHIVVVNGKPACSAELHLALLARAGITWEWTRDGSDGLAEIVYLRPGFPAPVTGSYSLAEAKTAGLLSNPTWAKYQKNMLRARAITNGARMIAPDILAGMSYTPEELGAEVDEDGQVISMPVQTPVQTRQDAPELTVTSTVDTSYQAPTDPAKDELIAAIVSTENQLHLNPHHIKNGRLKYAGNNTLTSCTLEGLQRYIDRLLAYAREKMQQTTTAAKQHPEVAPPPVTDEVEVTSNTVEQAVNKVVEDLVNEVVEALDGEIVL